MSDHNQRLVLAIKDYLNDTISIRKVPEFAGISTWEMINESKKRNLELKYKLSEAQLEIERLMLTS